MLDSNFQNKSCGFGEDLVAYLYDEIGENEKTKFEKHLGNCQICDKELQSFGFVRSSINDWKAEDFAKVSLPKIEIEYGEIEVQPQMVINEKRNWFDGLAGIFSGFPRWANASAAFAVLAFCAVIAVIALNYSGSEEIANNPETKSVEQPKSAQEKVLSPQEEEIAINQQGLEEPENNSVDENKTFTPEVVSKTEVKITPKKSRVVKKPNSTLAKNKKRENKVVENKKPNNQITANNSKQETFINNFSEQEIPKLSNFVEEDVEENDSIRLTDLFEEVGEDK